MRSNAALLPEVEIVNKQLISYVQKKRSILVNCLQTNVLQPRSRIQELFTCRDWSSTETKVIEDRRRGQQGRRRSLGQPRLGRNAVADNKVADEGQGQIPTLQECRSSTRTPTISRVRSDADVKWSTLTTNLRAHSKLRKKVTTQRKDEVTPRNNPTVQPVDCHHAV